MPHNLENMPKKVLSSLCEVYYYEWNYNSIIYDAAANGPFTTKMVPPELTNKHRVCSFFSAKESALQRPLDKHPLYVKVYNQDIHIGTATLKLTPRSILMSFIQKMIIIYYFQAHQLSLQCHTNSFQILMEVFHCLTNL